jgi:hypothetical protein
MQAQITVDPPTALLQPRFYFCDGLPNTENDSGVNRSRAQRP